MAYDSNMRSMYGAAGRGLQRPVWVKVGAFFEFSADRPAPAQVPKDALDLTYDAAGVLKEWVRSARGEWIGVVDYELKYADGRSDVYRLVDQRIPAYALRPRKYGG
jgi:hypothetical protein